MSPSLDLTEGCLPNVMHSDMSNVWLVMQTDWAMLASLRTSETTLICVGNLFHGSCVCIGYRNWINSPYSGAFSMPSDSQNWFCRRKSWVSYNPSYPFTELLFLFLCTWVKDEYYGAIWCLFSVVVTLFCVAVGGTHWQTEMGVRWEARNVAVHCGCQK
jgi:hypothetical protein